MSDRSAVQRAGRTGLGPLEVAALLAVAESGGDPAEPRPTVSVLQRLEKINGIAPRYAFPVVCDLTAWWRVHLRLLDDQGGNWGSAHGDPPADAQYTTVRLSALGELALASERGEVGPVPFGLIDGTLYKGGRVPPLDPRRVVSALAAAVDEPEVTDRRLLDLLGPPAVPTGGTVSGDIAALYAGESTWLDVGCRVVREETAAGPALVITGTPLGVALDELVLNVSSQVRLDAPDDDHPHQHPAGRAGRTVAVTSVGSGCAEPIGRRAVRLEDESTMYVGTRILFLAGTEVELDVLAQWLHGVWPVTVRTECQFSVSVATQLRAWAHACRAGRSGLDRPAELLP